MAVKIFLISVTLFACVEFLSASPARRQLITITEATASDSPVTNDGAVWDDNDEFDLDGQDWYSQPIVSPSAIPDRGRDYSDYDDDYSNDYSNHVNDNMVLDFGDSNDDEDQLEQDAEEEEDENNMSNELSFLPPRDTRLVLEDDDDDQSVLIKVRHTGRSSYPRISDDNDNSFESSEDDKDDNEHPYEFTIDEDDKDDEDDDEDDDDSIETLPRQEDEDDENEDELVSKGENGDMFENPEEDPEEIIYGDNVFLY